MSEKKNDNPPLVHEILIFIDPSIFVGEFRIIPVFSRWIFFCPSHKKRRERKNETKNLARRKTFVFIETFLSAAKKEHTLPHSSHRADSPLYLLLLTTACCSSANERVITAASSWEMSYFGHSSSRTRGVLLLLCCCAV